MARGTGKVRPMHTLVPLDATGEQNFADLMFRRISREQAIEQAEGMMLREPTIARVRVVVESFNGFWWYETERFEVSQ